ncbi:MAG: hypothetical protein NZZ41_07805, partial [Candidatus Dojkabacteria bacterium]|nr:hypothetical protein [Candidatus Dojkabacteria bacterium]
MTIKENNHSTFSKLGEYVWIVKMKLEFFDNFVIELKKKKMTIEQLKELEEEGEEITPDYFQLLENEEGKEKILKILEEYIKESKIKFPIQIQVCFKYLTKKIVVDQKTGEKSFQDCIISMRTDDISNSTYSANDIGEVKNVFKDEIETLLEKIESQPSNYDYEPNNLLSFVIRFWEYRPPFLIARGYIENPEWLEKRKLI